MLKTKKNVKISSYLDINLVSFLQANSRDEAIFQIIDNLEKFEKLPDRKLFYDAIMKRENIVSTGIGMGVAIPHAKLNQFDEFFIAIGIQKGLSLDWDSLDGTFVKLIFMIGGPENRQNEYLQILSSLTVIIKDEKLRKQLINALTKEEVIKLLVNY
ncbi:MAG: hypothetical protein AMS24_00565 [Chlamydiae bacterium SM23_39]|nr:MAG: hypothetical protein AMS24_00565 [Chlamydiae bacterium SM23_39]